MGCIRVACKFSGEIDKNPEWMARRTRPDFLIHVPGLAGEAGGNLVTMEVKPLRRTSPIRLANDVDKLRMFTSQGHYFLGVLLIYDHGGGELPPGKSAQLQELIRGREGKIVLAWHRGPGSEIKIVP